MNCNLKCLMQLIINHFKNVVKAKISASTDKKLIKRETDKAQRTQKRELFNELNMSISKEAPMASSDMRK